MSNASPTPQDPKLAKYEADLRAKADIRAKLKAEAAPKDGEKRIAFPMGTQNDSYNAKRLIHSMGGDFHFVPESGKWVRWDGARWVPDISGTPRYAAMQMGEAMFAKAKALGDEMGMVFAERTQSRNGVDASVDLAKAHPGIQKPAASFDKHPDLFNARSHTIQLRTGTAYTPRKGDLLTQQSPVEFNPDAPAVLWRQFLRDFTCGDQELEDYIQRMAGEAMVGSNASQKIHVLHSDGGSGKGVLTEVIEEVAGDYVRRMEPTSLMANAKASAGGAREDLVSLVGRRLVVVSETDKTAKANTALLKQLGGNGKMTARANYGAMQSFYAAWSLWIDTNYLPRIEDGDRGIWRRLVVVPCPAYFHDAAEGPSPRPGAPSVIKGLRDTILRRESEGVLAWLIEGAMKFLSVGLGSCRAIRQATDRYKGQCDPFGEWLDEHCLVDLADALLSIPSGALYHDYQDFMAEIGQQERILDPAAFADRLTQKGLETHKGSKGVRFRRHIRLLTTAEREVKRVQMGDAPATALVPATVSLAAAVAAEQGELWTPPAPRELPPLEVALLDESPPADLASAWAEANDSMVDDGPMTADE